MPKPILIVGGVVGLLVVAELIMLARLATSVGTYAAYWKKYPDTGTLTYVALGDSAAQGIGASKPEKGYVSLVAERLAETTGKSVRIVNLSVSGAKIEDVINDQLPQLKEYEYDLLTVEIGGNDVVKDDIATFAPKYEELAKLLPSDAYVSDIPYFGGRIRKNDRAIVASQAIAKSANTHGLRLVELQRITKEKDSLLNYAADLFHPSDRGYRVWAEAFWEAISQNE